MTDESELIRRIAKLEADRRDLESQLAEAGRLLVRTDRKLADAEQGFANAQVRQMRRTGVCPCCGAPAR
jgi:septal ring factor EnvC (AmiA/AmiB activator)